MSAEASVASSPQWMEIWFKFQWLGIVLLSPAYLHFSDALLATTGRPSRGRRRFWVRVAYLISLAFLVTLFFSLLVGPLVPDGHPSPHLERTSLTWVFTAYYIASMIWAWINFRRAYQRTVTTTSRRRMRYLITGALAPALGVYPYLLFGSGFAAAHSLIFWLAADISNILVAVLLVTMAYAVAFFGVPWPDRIVKRRLFKWLMRGPVTASTVLAVTTLVRRAGESLGASAYSAAVPITMVVTLLLMQFMVTILSPYWERWLFYGGDRANLQLLQTLEERLLTTSDLRQFLESVLTAICDRLQVSSGFVVALGPQGLELVVTVGDEDQLTQNNLSDDLLQLIIQNGATEAASDTFLQLFSWGDYWLVPLFEQENEAGKLLGLLGVVRSLKSHLDTEQRDALTSLVCRAAMALEDRSRQQEVFTSLESLTPQIGMLQRLRAAARYEGTDILTESDIQSELERGTLTKWVKDALGHYWGGPRLSRSPLLRLQVVQQSLKSHDDVSVNALRSILRKGIDHVRPEGDRRFTAEWILYNILEMKFMEGHKVHDIAIRLAVSEADLYRKQRVAIEAVANAIVEMEYKAREGGGD